VCACWLVRVHHEMGRVLYTTHMTVNAVSHRVHVYSFFRAIITGHNAVVWHLAGIHLALFLLFYYEIVRTQTFIYTHVPSPSSIIQGPVWIVAAPATSIHRRAK